MNTEPSLSVRVRKQRDKSLHQKILVETPPFPRNMMVELTNACNHACIFCTSAHMTRKIGRIDGALMERLLVEGREMGVEEVGFYTTGDPFVDNRLEQFVARAKELGYKYMYISTNGGLASPKRAKAAIDAGLTSIKFSINAGSRETYKLIHGKDEWDKILENLSFISEYRKTLGRPLSLFVTSIVTKQSSDEQEALRDAVGDLVDEVSFFPVHDQNGPMAQAMGMLAPTLEQENAAVLMGAGTCMMVFNRLHVTFEGHVTLCCADYQNYLTVADLDDTSLQDAWLSETFRDIRRRHLEDKLEGTLCGSCLHGSNAPIKPLQGNVATSIELDAFNRDAADRVAARLASHDTNEND
ncbi:radical SAM/SPASM domain-containing protein [Pseudomonadota bacterium]